MGNAKDEHLRVAQLFLVDIGSASQWCYVVATYLEHLIKTENTTYASFGWKKTVTCVLISTSCICVLMDMHLPEDGLKRGVSTSRPLFVRILKFRLYKGAAEWQVEHDSHDWNVYGQASFSLARPRCFQNPSCLLPTRTAAFCSFVSIASPTSLSNHSAFTKPYETVYPMAKNPIIIDCWPHSDLFTFFKRVIQESTAKAAKAQYRWVCPTTRYTLITWPSTPSIMGNLNFSTVGRHLGVIHRGKMMINQIRWEWECIGFQTMDSSVVPPKLMVDWWLIFG
jgi:hypothetical protein